MAFIHGPLRAEERARVEQHIDECADCRWLLSETTKLSSAAGHASGPDSTAPPNRADPLVLLRGDLIGRYVILEWVGTGAMGVVYAAYDPHLDRKIAIKVLRNDSIDGHEAHGRRLREAQALARLSHPNVVSVHDAGTFADRVFVAMEFVPGATVKRWLAQASPGWREVLKLFLAAGRGLAAAHAAGLIHRDLKPENILMADDGRVCVGDFGLACAQSSSDSLVTDLDPSAQPLERISQSGSLAGTPAYMAPEQLSGAPATVHSDQFSYCVALYEALYRESPFAGETLPALARRKEMGQIREAPKRSRVPRGLRRRVLRGLQPDPTDRYRSMDALLHTLMAYSARSKRSLAVAAIACLAVATIAGNARIMKARATVCQGTEHELASVWDQEKKRSTHEAFLATKVPYADDAWVGTERALDSYTHEWVTMRAEVCDAVQRHREVPPELIINARCLDRRLIELKALTDLLVKADSKVVEKAIASTFSLYRLDGCRRGGTTSNQAEGPAIREKGRELIRRLAQAKALQETGRYGEGLELASLAVNEARQLGNTVLISEAQYRLGILNLAVGNGRASEAALTEAFVAAEEAGENELAALASSRLVYAVGFLEDRPEDADHWDRLATVAIGRLGGDDGLRSDLLGNRGAVRWVQGRYEESLACYLDALALKKPIRSEEQLGIAGIYMSLGNVFMPKGEYERAESYFRQAVALDERWLGSNHPDLVLPNTLNGFALLEQQKYEESMGYFRRALSISEKVESSLLMEVHLVRLGMCKVMERQGRYEEALIQCQKSLALANKSHSPFAPDALTVLGHVYLGKKDVLNGLASLERALAIGESRSTHPHALAETRLALAQALWDAHRDRPRALRLAADARDAWAKAGNRRKRSQAEDWLASKTPH